MSDSSPFQVSLVRCADYDAARVEQALGTALAPLGGMSHFVRPGQRVLLKPNLLIPAAPERAVTTHPAVMEAVVRLVLGAGGRPLIAESATAVEPYTPAGLSRLYRATGMAAVAERTGAELNLDTEVVDLACPPGCRLHRFEVMRPLAEADVVISLPKLKTHVLTTFTGATKNLFGVIPGVRKAGYHVALTRLDDFADMLLDVTALANPALVVMDAVVGMDGDGPSGGGIFPIGLLMAATSSIALDVVAAQVVGIPPRQVPMLRRAAERGFWSGDPADVALLGLSLEEARVAGFRRPAANPPIPERMVPGRLWPQIRRLAVRVMTRRPVPRAGRCTACRTCEKACPVQAIAIVEKLARVDDRKCIRCYCCHEVCPEQAIDLVTPWLVRAMNRVMG
jgi:uncharacterized protein (DUF362 family)/Pyruvate/2-oxoacid:ferredoxin oxidoreductase delta subunit